MGQLGWVCGVKCESGSPLEEIIIYVVLPMQYKCSSIHVPSPLPIELENSRFTVFPQLSMNEPDPRTH